ncbi:hypothetical protein [Aneurinibacillus migulanus]|uniref:Uncharacterized protein n=1 Tax=Aneurinibacillus migulanus TaxID=47500 RepID=A0A0D1Y8E3_ANEMI|nr:hypothetical protein [Aneurinibacillus migulanus]KIV55407.1 hypothetical protein TS65_16235 [Aneurinibacillus migulanus]KON95028.1 hypothetical protein AF333_05565 [Aneurinibacillus migulanus]MED0892017.1 hypothetical protein [Aneurinibacillus migulanus]MED1618345.1 hypothetical protein [Aneurinibacillus migulanus]MED4730044.1 hypothetical protein [Aneurinibacillus migulanus]
MKKAVIAFLFVFLLLPGLVSAQEYTEPATIKKVYYDAEAQAYYIQTVDENQEEFWHYGLVFALKEDKALTKYLNQTLVNKNAMVTYEDYESDDPEDWELLDFVIVD